jgi:cobalt-precorrin-7 (C5)-methyltransferase
MVQNRAYIVGVGPGSPEYVTAEAQRVIGEADIVVGWEFNFFPVKSLTAGKKAYIQHAGDYLKIAKAAADEARANSETIAVLRIGDPCISSGLNGLIRVFHDFDVVIISGISSVQVAAAAARINIDESVIISFHEDNNDLKEKQMFMLDALRRKRHLIVITGPVQKPSETANYLIKHGINEAAPVLVCENLTLNGERIFRGTLKDAATKQFSWLSVMVIICQDS